jgi:hypothetical protein
MSSSSSLQPSLVIFPSIDLSTKRGSTSRVPIDFSSKISVRSKEQKTFLDEMSECYDTAERKELEGDFSDANDYLYNYYSRLCGITFSEVGSVTYKEGQTISFDWRSNYTSGNGVFHFFNFNQEKVMILHKILLNHFRIAMSNINSGNTELARNNFRTCSQICDYISGMKAVKADFLPGKMPVEMSFVFVSLLSSLFRNLSYMCVINFENPNATNEFYRDIYYSCSNAAEQTKKALDSFTKIPNELVGTEIYLFWAQCRCIAMYHESKRLLKINEIKEIEIASGVCEILFKEIEDLEKVYVDLPITNISFEENIVTIKNSVNDLKKECELYCNVVQTVPKNLTDFELGLVAKKIGTKAESDVLNQSQTATRVSVNSSWKPFKPLSYPQKPPPPPSVDQTAQYSRRISSSQRHPGKRVAEHNPSLSVSQRGGHFYPSRSFLGNRNQ